MKPPVFFSTRPAAARGSERSVTRAPRQKE